MVGAALPEPTAEAFNVSDSFFLIRKIHLPYERPITEHPHDKLTGARERSVNTTSPVTVIDRTNFLFELNRVKNESYRIIPTVMIHCDKEDIA